MMLRLCGEITTKSPGIRKQFNRRLVQNVRDALARHGIEARVRDQWYRIDVVTDDKRAMDVASRIYGIQAASWTRAYRWESIDDIVAIGTEIFADRVAGKTFAVRTRRAGRRDKIPFTSVDVDRALGTELVKAGGRVDLDNFEVRAGIEIRQDGSAYFFDDETLGVAGLPNGVEGRALALLSGGFDSAVAAWTMMRRGVDLDFLFFNLAGPPQERAVKEVGKKLCERWAFGYSPRLFVVDFRPMIAEMQDKVDGHYWQVLLKRLMMRAGQTLAEHKDYSALITGESCGQVSSQTLMNLAAIGAPITTAIMRPLVGMNKEEIIERSRLVGTHDLSRDIPEFCSLKGGRPIVDATVAGVDEAEAKVDGSLIAELVDHRQNHRILEMEAEEVPKVRRSSIPEGAMILDLRDEAAFSRWAYKGAVNMPLGRALEQVGLLPKEATYVLYCEVGLKSAFVAEQMTRLGYEAYSFSGGVPKLKKLAKGERGSKG